MGWKEAEVCLPLAFFFTEKLNPLGLDLRVIFKNWSNEQFILWNGVLITGEEATTFVPKVLKANVYFLLNK